MRSKFLGYKLSLNEIKTKECPLSLKIIVLKSMRNNLIYMIKQNKQLIKEKKVTELSFLMIFFIFTLFNFYEFFYFIKEMSTIDF